MSQAMPIYEATCHLPCPDLPCYSLNADQKRKGLASLERVRAQLREQQLKPLREKRTELAAQAKHEDTTQIMQHRIAREIELIDSKAVRIQARWS